MDNMAIEEKEAKPIHAEGTCTYIIPYTFSLQIIRR
jgi:hypothetical protein